MARIRSIKPEFPHSESMGNISRDARLTFILLWTIADDEGRLRGNSRMLASLLFPYDEDSRALIEGWLTELEGEGCIRRYSVDGASYLQIAKWREHQKIDKPSKSKFPQFENVIEDSPNAREDSRGLSTESGTFVVGSKDQGEDLRIKDLSEREAREAIEKPPDGAALENLANTIIAAWKARHGTPGILAFGGHFLTERQKQTIAKQLLDPGWDWELALSKFPLKWPGSFTLGQFLEEGRVREILDGKYDKWNEGAGGPGKAGANNSPGKVFDPKTRDPNAGKF